MVVSLPQLPFTIPLGHWVPRLVNIAALGTALGLVGKQVSKGGYKSASWGALWLTVFALIYQLACFVCVEFNFDVTARVCDKLKNVTEEGTEPFQRLYRSISLLLALWYLCTGTLYVQAKNTSTMGYGIYLLFLGTFMIVPFFKDKLGNGVMENMFKFGDTPLHESEIARGHYNRMVASAQEGKRRLAAYSPLRKRMGEGDEGTELLGTTAWF
jgi:hypothetical protein